MGKGQSWGGAIGFAEEETYATYVVPDFYVPITSESLKGTRPSTPATGIYTTRVTYYQLPGIIEAGGNFQFEADAHHLGFPLKWWNGQVSTATFCTGGTPSGTPAAGGSLTAGTYYYRTAAVLQRTSDGKRFWGSGSASSTSVTTSSGDLTVDLTWSNPSPPSGFTLYGTAIFRTASGGANTTQKYLATVVGSGTSYSDTGAVALSTIAFPATIYEHTYVPAAPIAGTHPLPSFSVTKLMDQSGTSAEAYYGGRMNTFSFSVGDPNAPPTSTFEMMCRNFEAIANPSPSYTAVRPMMNWQGFASIDGTMADYFEGCDFTATNNLEKVPSLAGVQYHRDFYPGIREVSGSVKFGFENKNHWTKMVNATEFALTLNCEGLPTTSGYTTISTVNYSAMPYAIQLHMPKCLYQEGGGNLSQAERMVETLPFKTAIDSGVGYELQIKLWNTTASYA